MLIIGATGPVDAARRRPWIDWIHTSADQGALIRAYSKWDDQPASVEAALDSLARAYSITRQAPSAPVYVCLDVSLQEQPLPDPPAIPDVSRDRSPRSHGPDAAAVAATLDLLRARAPPAVPARPAQPRRAGLGPPGRAGRTVRRAGHLRPQERRGLPDRAPAAPEPARHLPARRVRRADRRRGPDREPGLGRPGRHPRRGGQPRPSGAGADHLLHDGLRAAQRLVQGFLRPRAGRPVRPRRPGPAGARAARIRRADQAERVGRPRLPPHPRPVAGGGPDIFMHDLARRAARTRSATNPPAWSGSRSAGAAPTSRPAIRWTTWAWTAARASAPGPGMAVGAALALEGSGRLPVAVLGDGDFLMGGTAVWTAAHYRLPLLIVVANNAFFYNDVVHQERIAAQRQRPARNSWIGQAIADPDPDLPALARSLGFQAADQVRDRAELPAALAEAVAAARSGHCVLVDVRVRPDGYAATGGYALARSVLVTQNRPGADLGCGTAEVTSSGGIHTEPRPGGRRARRRGLRGHPGRGQPRDEPASSGRFPGATSATSRSPWPPRNGPRPAGGRPSPSCARPRCSPSPTPWPNAVRSSPGSTRWTTAARCTRCATTSGWPPARSGTWPAWRSRSAAGPCRRPLATCTTRCASRSAWSPGSSRSTTR